MSAPGLGYSTRYYLRRIWTRLVDISGVAAPPHIVDEIRQPDHHPTHLTSSQQYQQHQQQQQHIQQQRRQSERLIMTERGTVRTTTIERGEVNLPLGHHSPHGYHHSSPIDDNGVEKQYYKSRSSFIGFDTTNVVEDPAICAILLTCISVILIFISLPFSLFFCIKVVQEYERAVIFRLGRLVTGGARGPGIFFIIPCIDTYSKADLRTVSFDVPPQEILSKDSVTVAVDAVVYFRISNAISSVSNVEDYARSTRLLAATTLRNVLGTKNLSELLSERESISHMIQSNLDEATDSWGVKVERVEIKDVRLPIQLQRAMAAEAEAAREARAKVIAATGEQRASGALKEAADVISCSPAALQLRYLQTLNSIAAEKNSTIVFPVPMELFRGFCYEDEHIDHQHDTTTKDSDYTSEINEKCA